MPFYAFLRNVSDEIIIVTLMWFDIIYDNTYYLHVSAYAFKTLATQMSPAKCQRLEDLFPIVCTQTTGSKFQVSSQAVVCFMKAGERVHEVGVLNYERSLELQSWAYGFLSVILTPIPTQQNLFKQHLLTIHWEWTDSLANYVLCHFPPKVASHFFFVGWGPRGAAEIGVCTGCFCVWFDWQHYV